MSLESEVQRANALAEQRAEDNSLGELINQGRAEIAEGQETVEGLLEEILGNQNKTLEAVQEATRTVEAMEEMTEKSLEAQSAIQAALREQMNAIKIAYQQNLITLEQARTNSFNTYFVLYFYLVLCLVYLPYALLYIFTLRFALYFCLTLCVIYLPCALLYTFASFLGG